MRPTLLLTKLQRPPARPGLVPRARLLARLGQGLAAGRGLTLVSAPAGYGKSVLVAEWLRSLDADGSQAFWLSLETADNDPARFLAYFSAAFGQDALDHALEIQEIGDWSDFQPIERLLTRWLNSLVPAAGSPLVLVLDDYHRILEPAIHQAIQFLLEHRPPALHLVLITREDPPLPLARLRALAELTEVRAEDLSFTAEEAAAFICQTMHLELRPDSVAALTARTEGWIAGLQLAALSLRQRGDVETLLADLKGSHRYLVDYLVDEVLRALPAETRRFLCHTALLKRFSAGLCDALTGRDDSSSLLRSLEQANLFLIPLDEQRQWFRYHHLFADCLRSELAVEDRRPLYGRAARWCSEHGLFEDAVEYALASGDSDLAADTIESVLKNPAAWSSGHLSMLSGWLNALPGHCIRCRPGLQTVAARAFSLAGRFEQARSLLDQAEQQLTARPAATSSGGLPTANATTDCPPDTLSPTERDLLLAQIGIYRAAILAANGELAAARTDTRSAMARLPAGHPHLEARAYDSLAVIEAQAGNLAQAEAHFLEAADLAGAAGVAYLEINARCEAVGVRLAQGRLNDAEALCRAILERVQPAPAAQGLAAQSTMTAERTPATGPIPPAGLAWAILGDILRERNQLALAEQAIATGIELAREGGLIDDLQQAHFTLARLKLAQGDPEAARQSASQSLRILKAYRLPRLHALARMLEARLALQLGNRALASEWASEAGPELLTQASEYRRDPEFLTLARVRLAENRPDAARPLLAAIEADARAKAHLSTLMEARILLALAARQQGRDDEAVPLLLEAVALAEPQGYVRLFLDEGEAMAGLLGRCLSQRPPAALQRYIDRLLTAFAEPPFGAASADPAFGATVNPAYRPAADDTVPTLPDPLSPQEIRILRLMAGGASNAVIAETLFISIGTTKWHVHNIFEKLTVGSRTQAVSRGRELGLVE